MGSLHFLVRCINVIHILQNFDSNLSVRVKTHAFQLYVFVDTLLF